MGEVVWGEGVGDGRSIAEARSWITVDSVPCHHHYNHKRKDLNSAQQIGYTTAMCSPRLSFLCCRSTLVLTLMLTTLGVTRADEAMDAKAVTSAFLKLTDQEDVEGSYRMAGEQLKNAAPKAETIAGLKKWFAVKGGAASLHEIVQQRTYSEAEANATFPQVKTKGSLYIFRYRSNYPNGTFFEDLYVSRDSDGVLRINGHMPQPA